MGVKPASEFIAHPNNWRIHPKAQREALVGALDETGWVAPVIESGATGYTLDGHARVEEALKRGDDTPIPYIVLDLLEQEEPNFLSWFDPIGALAAADKEQLDALLRDVDTGSAALQEMLSDLAAKSGLEYGKPEAAEDPGAQIDRAEELRGKWGTERGQLWEIPSATVAGKCHRLLCGDSTSAEDVARLMDNVPINVAFTSPPYAEQREYDAESGFKPIPPDEYVAWFGNVQANVAEHLAPDGSWFVNIKPPGHDLDTHLYVFDLVIAHVRQWGWHFATEFCWERIGVPKQVVLRFKNQFEPVYQFARGRWKIRPENVRHASKAMIVPIGKGAGDTSWDRQQVSGEFFKPQQVRKRKHGTTGLMSGVQALNAAPGEGLTEGWAYPGNRLPPLMETHQATGHAAAFPVGLPAFFIKAFSDTGDTVYEPFCGSGSTIVAANQNERVCYAMELSPAYIAVALERLAGMGLEPRLTT